MFLFLPVNQLALGTLPPAALKNASGLYNLMRNLGGAIGIAADRHAGHHAHRGAHAASARAGDLGAAGRDRRR